MLGTLNLSLGPQDLMNLAWVTWDKVLRMVEVRCQYKTWQTMIVQIREISKRERSLLATVIREDCKCHSISNTWKLVLLKFYILYKNIKDLEREEKGTQEQGYGTSKERSESEKKTSLYLFHTEFLLFSFQT